MLTSMLKEIPLLAVFNVVIAVSIIIVQAISQMSWNPWWKRAETAFQRLEQIDIEEQDEVVISNSDKGFTTLKRAINNHRGASGPIQSVGIQKGSSGEFKNVNLIGSTSVGGNVSLFVDVQTPEGVKREVVDYHPMDPMAVASLNKLRTWVRQTLVSDANKVVTVLALLYGLGSLYITLVNTGC